MFALVICDAQFPVKNLTSLIMAHELKYKCHLSFCIYIVRLTEAFKLQNNFKCNSEKNR